MRAARRRQLLKRHAKRLSPFDLMLLLVVIAACAYAAKPLLDDCRASADAERVISSMTSVSDRTDEPNRKESLAQAQAFNAALSAGEGHANNRGMAGGNEGQSDILDLLAADAPQEVAPYAEQLCWDGQAALCWIEIPRISVREPVYHGASDETLAMGVGHLDWSSLPVGGTSTHCALAAHSGMEESRMFDDLDQLGSGDVFVLHTLGDAYQYEVYGVETVLPHDAEQSCLIEPGKDLCTLITCTPYGINTHRLLVHGRRVPFAAPASRQDASTQVIIRADDLFMNRRTAPLAHLATAALLLAACWLLRGIVRGAVSLCRWLYGRLYGILVGREARP